jgi:hypothetical protein
LALNNSGGIVLDLQLRGAKSETKLLPVAAMPQQPEGKTIKTSSNSVDHPERIATKKTNPKSAKSRSPHVPGGY